MTSLNILKGISRTCSFIVFAIGLVLVLSWHFGYFSLLQLPPAKSTISYRVSVILLITGFGLMTLFNPLKYILTKLCGFLIILFAGLSVFETTLGLDDQIDNFINRYFLYFKAEPLSLSVIAALCYCLIGLIFIFWRGDKSSRLANNFLLLFSIAISFLATLSMVSEVLPIQSAVGWSDKPFLHFYSSLGVFLTGLGLISACFYFELLTETRIVSWLPTMLTIVGLIFTILTGLGFKEKRDNEISLSLESNAKTIVAILENDIEDIAQPFNRMISRIEVDGTPPQKDWKADADLFIRDFPELELIAWTDPKLIVKNIVPYTLEGKYLHNHVLPVTVNLNIEESLLNSKVDKNPFGALFDGLDMLWLFGPTFWKEENQGFLVYLVKPSLMFKRILESQVRDDVYLEVYHNNTLIYSQNKQRAIDISKWKITEPFSFYNLDFKLLVGPTESFITRNLGNQFLYVVLINGFLISIAFGVMTYLWQLAQQKILSYKDSQLQLQKTKDDLFYTLETADIGTWIWDLKTNKLFWNDVCYKIFGIKSTTHPVYQTFFNLIADEDKEKLDQNIHTAVETGSSFSHTYKIIRPDNTSRYIMSRGRTHSDDTGEITTMRGICWDVTNTKKTQLYLETIDRISKALNESITLAEAAIKTRHILYRVFGWEVLAIWVKDRKDDSLKCMEISTFHELDIPSFEKYAREHPQTKAEIVPGLILSTHRPIWYGDYPKVYTSKRSESAEIAKLKGYCGIPLFAGSTLVGIAELFKTKPFMDEIDESLLNLTTSIGIYLGQFIQKRANQEAQAQLASIVTHAPGAIYICDIEGTIQTWNTGAEQLYGWHADEIIGKHVTLLYPAEMIDLYKGIIAKLRAGESINRIESRRLTKNGQLIWVDNSYAPIRNESGDINSYCVITQETTKQKQALIDLKRSEEKFRSFVETTEEWIWEIDTSFCLRYTNPTIEKLLGFAPSEVIGKELFIFIPEKHRDKVRNEIAEFINSKHGWKERVYKARCANGTIKYLESNAMPIFDDKGNVTGFRGADHDVTERQLIERSKTEFISTVSHELRTPLTSIHGALGLISSMKDLPPKVQELSSIAYRNSGRLGQIIKDILDLERSKLGKLELKTKPIYLAEIITESIISMKAMAEKYQVSLKEDQMLPSVKVFADPERLIQVVSNLLSNAIKFSHPLGNVYVKMEKIDKDVRVSVIDEGVGIPKQFESKVFNRFSQADSSDARSVGGAGLGLNICKNIIDQIGGKIGFTTVYGKGTTFYFDLLIISEGT